MEKSWIAVAALVLLFFAWGLSAPAQQELPEDIVVVGTNWAGFLLADGQFRRLPYAVLEVRQPPPVPVTPEFVRGLRDICRQVETESVQCVAGLPCADSRARCVDAIRHLGPDGIGAIWGHVRRVSPPGDDGCRRPSLEEWDRFHRLIARALGGRLLERWVVQTKLEVRASLSQQVRDLRRGCA